MTRPLTPVMRLKASQRLLVMQGQSHSWSKVSVRIWELNGRRTERFNRGFLSACSRRPAKVSPRLARELGVRYEPAHLHGEGWIPPRKAERLRNAAAIILLMFIVSQMNPWSWSSDAGE